MDFYSILSHFRFFKFCSNWLGSNYGHWSLEFSQVPFFDKKVLFSHITAICLCFSRFGSIRGKNLNCKITTVITESYVKLMMQWALGMSLAPGYMAGVNPIRFGMEKPPSRDDNYPLGRCALLTGTNILVRITSCPKRDPSTSKDRFLSTLWGWTSTGPSGFGSG